MIVLAGPIPSPRSLSFLHNYLLYGIGLTRYVLSMSLILSVLWRLIVITFALFVALLGAAMILSYGISSGLFVEFFGADSFEAIDETEWGYAVLLIATVGIGFFTSFQLASLALLPIIVAIATTEMMRWNGMVTHLVLGGVSSLFVVFTQLPQGTTPSEGTLIVTLAMGFVGGFFYWLIAGRGAGKWQERLPALSKEDADGKGGEDARE